MSSNSVQNTMSAPTKSVAKKVVKKTETEAVPVAPAPTPVATPAPKVAKRASSAAPTASAPVAAPATVAPVATAQPVSETAPVEETSWTEELTTLQAQLTAIRDAVATAILASKRLEKRANREIKNARKNRRRSRNTTVDGAERKPSIFQIPVPITNELATFLAVPRTAGEGPTMSRSQVTKAISAYVKENKLNEKHKIHPNAALRKLLGVKEGEELTIFNMQTYLQKHYIKPTPAASA